MAKESELSGSLQFSNCPGVILFYPPVTRNSLSARNKSNKTNRGAQFFRNSVPISDFYGHLLLGLRSGGLNAILKLYSLEGASRKGAPGIKYSCKFRPAYSYTFTDVN